VGVSKLVFYILAVGGQLCAFIQSSHHFKRKRMFEATDVYISEILIPNREHIIPRLNKTGAALLPSPVVISPSVSEACPLKLQ